MLETYEATRFIKVLESGRTRPILLECELADDDGVSVGSFVVKANGGLPVSIDKQKTMAARLDVLTTETDRLESFGRCKIAELDELKRSILQKAFSGLI